MARKPKSDLPRTETVNVRLDPRLRWAVELASAKDRVTVSTFVERAVEKAVRQAAVTWHSIPQPSGQLTMLPTAWDIAVYAWHPDATVRTVRLAVLVPELLSSSEAVVWRLVLEHFSRQGQDLTALFEKLRKRGDRESEDRLMQNLIDTWPLFEKVARSELPESELPAWPGDVEEKPKRKAARA